MSNRDATTMNKEAAQEEKTSPEHQKLNLTLLHEDAWTYSCRARKGGAVRGERGGVQVPITKQGATGGLRPDKVKSPGQGQGRSSGFLPHCLGKKASLAARTGLSDPSARIDDVYCQLWNSVGRRVSRREHEVDLLGVGAGSK